MEVFSKDHAMSLPPHRDYDCAIDLLPGAPLPKGRLYSLSNAENCAMEEYINSSLQTGIIRPSSSPVGAGFFFVEKKDKTSSLHRLHRTQRHHNQEQVLPSPNDFCV